MFCITRHHLHATFYMFVCVIQCVLPKSDLTIATSLTLQFTKYAFYFCFFRVGNFFSMDTNLQKS